MNAASGRSDGADEGVLGEIEQDLVHRPRRAAGGIDPHHPRRHAGHRGSRRHRAQHHRPRCYACIVADDDIAQELRSRADYDAGADFRMPFGRFDARAAQRHVLLDGHVVADHRRLAHHQTGGVVEEDAAPEPGRRMDIGLKYLRAAALQVLAEVALAVQPQPVGQPVRLDGVEALDPTSTVRLRNLLINKEKSRFKVDCGANGEFPRVSRSTIA
jgi:hypothetical protein